MSRRQAEWPDAMTTLSTHDTKRSEDVRARIAVLAEAPGPVGADAGRRCSTPRRCPTRASANLLWQAAYGAWPISPGAAARLRREGDARGRRPHDLDRPGRGATSGPCTPRSTRRTTTSGCARALEALDAELSAAGPRQRPVRQAALADACPGVPDVYQGSELGDLSLVDPDNRRPVDFDAAERALAAGSNPKQALTARALRLRRDRPELFTSYTPLRAAGTGRRARARLRPRRRRHRRDPAAARAGERAAAGATPTLALAGRDRAPGRRAARRRAAPRWSLLEELR